MLGTLTDVSARRMAQAELVRNALLLAHLQDCVILTDLDGIVTYWKDGARRLLGWSAHEMIGRPLVEWFPPEARHEVEAMTRAILAAGTFEGEFEDWHKDGSRVWISTRVTAIADDTGAVVGLMGVSRDITPQKRAEAERDAARRLERVGRADVRLPQGRSAGHQLGVEQPFCPPLRRRRPVPRTGRRRPPRVRVRFSWSRMKRASAASRGGPSSVAAIVCSKRGTAARLSNWPASIPRSIF